MDSPMSAVRPSPAMRRVWWLLYALAWTTAAALWALATVAGSARLGGTFRELLPTGLYFGASMMGAGSLLGIAVWRLTGWLAWSPGQIRFLGAHLAAMCAYSLLVGTAFIWPDLLMMRTANFWARVFSYVLPYNMLTGAWLYLTVAGLSYVIRGQQRIRAEEAAVVRAQLLAQQAQLAALRAQINPHFLFNALHTVGALITVDAALADRALEQLGDLLRYTLDTEESVAFEREWGFVLDYLEFERLRYGDRMQVDASVDPAAHQVQVPPLILQPLVENAVRYGVADRPDGGPIAIAAGVDSDTLIVSISNEVGTDPIDSGMGIGIASVRRRLEACYGQRASLEVRKDEKRCVVTVAVPATPGVAEAS